MQVLHGAARRFAELAQVRAQRGADQCVGETRLVAEGHGGAMRAVRQVLARGAVVEGHRGDAAGHGLERDVAEGLGQAGEAEHVGAGEAARQRVAALHAGEDEVRVGFLQRTARRAVADPDETRVRPRLLQQPEAAHGQRQVLLGRDAADVDHDRGAVRGAPAFAQCRVAPARVEGAGVDRAAQPHGAVETLLRERVLQLAGGHQGGVGAVVEAAQPGEHPGAEETGAVAAHVIVEAGVETRGHGDAQASAGLQRRPAQRALGGDVDRVRPLRRPARRQPLAGRQAEAQARVARDRRAFHQHQRGVGTRAVVLALGSHQADRVAEPAQAVFERLHGERDAVDVGRVGFGDQFDVQAGVHGLHSAGAAWKPRYGAIAPA